jgi:hypothetical protein
MFAQQNLHKQDRMMPMQVVVAEEGLQATVVVPYVEFVLMEVLKNSLQVCSKEDLFIAFHCLTLLFCLWRREGSSAPQGRDWTWCGL